jgi:hypothetical protein
LGNLWIADRIWVIFAHSQYEERATRAGGKTMHSPDVSKIVDRIRAVAADESVPVKERLDSVKEIADAAAEQEDKLTLSLDASSD